MNARGPIWKIAVRTTPEAEDAITELLNGILQQPVSSYTDIETRVVTVASYLSAGVAKEYRISGRAALRNGLQRIRRCGLNIGSSRVSLEKIRREDWAESWKRHFKPIEIGSALLIKPGWARRKPKKGQAIVVLDPGLSFGTGQHPTTSFCLRQIASRSALITPRSSQSFLDIGTGSGILAIAAAKLGYAPVDAFDFDPEAVRIARDNARKNRVPSRVHITRGDVTKLATRSAKRYDLICANLISTLLIAGQPRILSRLKENGVLVLAGILKTEFTTIQKAYEKSGLRLIASQTEKEWRSGAFTYRRQAR